jgi:FKBP-type peptidyl-prolyl cis-trans isomerase
MNFKLLLAVACAAVIGLTGCGGGGGGSSSSSSSDSATSSASNPSALSFTDNTVGTGTTFASGMVASVTYTGWLYTSTATDKKGTQFATGSTFFLTGASKVITGLETGMAGMKVGGKRTILIPSSQAFGATGATGVPANVGVVYEVTLTALQTVSTPTALTTTDITVGTGAAAVSGKTATVTYTGWLYNDAATDRKGAQFDSGSFSFALGSNAVITGFEQGVTGMLVGGKRTIVIPASMAYGSTGNSSIPPNAGLVFDVTLTGVQ